MFHGDCEDLSISFTSTLAYKLYDRIFFNCLIFHLTKISDTTLLYYKYASDNEVLEYCIKVYNLKPQINSVGCDENVFPHKGKGL